MKCEALLELRDRVELVAAARVLELRKRLVRALDVGRVVAAVMQLENLARQQRLQRVIRVGQIGQLVFGHWTLLIVLRGSS
jgi:hypothetical protein